MKGEPEWMTKFRLRSLEIFRKKPMPNWGADLSVIDFENIFYYLKPAEKQKIDRKSTRLNSSHVSISYAVFCLKKKNTALRIRLMPALPPPPSPRSSRPHQSSTRSTPHPSPPAPPRHHPRSQPPASPTPTTQRP